MVWDSPVRLSCFLFSVASVFTRKDRFHHKGCALSIQGRNVLISVMRTISSVNRNQTQFQFKTRKETKTKTKTPTLGDLALAKLPLEDSKVKTLKREEKCNRIASVFTSTGTENTVLSGPPYWCRQDDQVDTLC